MLIFFAHHTVEHTEEMNLPVIVGVVLLLACLALAVFVWRSNK